MQCSSTYVGVKVLDESRQNAGADDAQHVGSFRFFFESETWEWSDEVARLHGYRPGEVTPTTALLATHKHPDDRDAFETMVHDMLIHRTPFSSRHRIVDKAGRTRHVTVVAQPMLDSDGLAIGTEGFYLDMTEMHTEALREVDRHIDQFRKTQSVIEQAKGMIMLVYSVSDDRAFEVLRWRSQTSNTKLHVICSNIVTASSGVTMSGPTRQQFDQLLLSSHLPLDEVADTN